MKRFKRNFLFVVVLIFTCLILTGCPCTIDPEHVKDGSIFEGRFGYAFSSYGIEFDTEDTPVARVSYQLDDGTEKTAVFLLDGYNNEARIGYKVVLSEDKSNWEESRRNGDMEAPDLNDEILLQEACLQYEYPIIFMSAYPFQNYTDDFKAQKDLNAFIQSLDEIMMSDEIQQWTKDLKAKAAQFRLDYYNELFDEKYTSYEDAVQDEMVKYENNNDKDALYRLCKLLNGSSIGETDLKTTAKYYAEFFEKVLSDKDYFDKTQSDHKWFAGDYLCVLFELSEKAEAQSFLKKIENAFSDKKDIVIASAIYAESVMNNVNVTDADIQFLFDRFLKYEKEYINQVEPSDRIVIYYVLETVALRINDNALSAEYKEKQNEQIEKMLNFPQKHYSTEIDILQQ